MFSDERLLLSSQLFPNQLRTATTSVLWSAASRCQFNAMMHGETGELLELRKELEKEMEEISEDFISTRSSEVEMYLDKIKKMKIEYQGKIDDFIEKYQDLAEDPVLDKWRKEISVSGIANEVKLHANKIRIKTMEVSVSGPYKPVNVKKTYTESEKVAATTWLLSFMDRHVIGTAKKVNVANPCPKPPDSCTDNLSYLTSHAKP